MQKTPEYTNAVGHGLDGVEHGEPITGAVFDRDDVVQVGQSREQVG